MTDLTQILHSLRRPRLLIRAARFGVVDYNRDRDLRRLMRAERTPSPAWAVGALLEEEGRMEAIRQTGDAGYSVARHIELLIALMAEARLLPGRQVGV